MLQEDLVKRAKNAILLNDYDLAEKLTKKIVELNPKDYLIRIFFGNIFAKQRNYTRAIVEYQNSIDLKNENSEAYNNIALMYKELGDKTAALKNLKKAHKLSPDRADILYNIGNLLKNSGQPKKAISYYENAIKKDENFVLAYNNIGTIYQSLNDFDKAKEFFITGLSLDQNNSSLRFNLGLLYKAQNKYSKSLIEFSKALKTRPNWTDALYELSSVQQYLKNSSSAIKNLYAAEKINPESTKVKNSIAYILSESENKDQAITYIEKSLKENTDNLNLAESLISLYFIKNDIPKARDLIEKYLRRYPDNENLNLLKAKGLLKSLRLKEAFVILNTLYKKNPEKLEILNCLGFCYLKSKNTKNAKKLFKKSLIIDSRNYDALFQLANIHRDEKKFEKAFKEIKKILNIYPEDFEANYLLACTFYEQGKLEIALDLFKDLNSEYSQNQKVLGQIIKILKEQKKDDESLVYIENLISLREDLDNTEDLDQLSDFLNVYEDILEKPSKAEDGVWEKSIKSFSGMISDLTTEKKEQESGSIILESENVLVNEDVPVIDIGGLEPIFAIREEEEDINLIEEDEIIIDSSSDDNEEPAWKPDDFNEKRDPFDDEPLVPAKPQNLPEHIPQGLPQIIVMPNPAPQKIESVSTFSGNLKLDSEKGLPIDLNFKGFSKKDRPLVKKKIPIKKKEVKTEDKKEDKKPVSPGLFAYLENLTDYLPENEKKDFSDSGMELRMESLRLRMQGKKGLISQIKKPDIIKEDPKMTKDNIVKTFDFIEKLSDYYPDKKISGSIKNKLSNIVNELKGETIE